MVKFSIVLNINSGSTFTIKEISLKIRINLFAISQIRAFSLLLCCSHFFIYSCFLSIIEFIALIIASYKGASSICFAIHPIFPFTSYLLGTAKQLFLSGNLLNSRFSFQRHDHIYRKLLFLQRDLDNLSNRIFLYDAFHDILFFFFFQVGRPPTNPWKLSLGGCHVHNIGGHPHYCLPSSLKESQRYMSFAVPYLYFILLLTVSQMILILSVTSSTPLCLILVVGPETLSDAIIVPSLS